MKTARIPALLLAVLALAAGPAQAGTIVCVETNLDTFCMEMQETDAPNTSAAFLANVDAGVYSNTLIDLSLRRSYLMGGRFKVPYPLLATSSYTVNSAGTLVSSSGPTISTGKYSDVTSTSSTTDSDKNIITTTILVSPSDKLDPLPVTPFLSAAALDSSSVGNVRGSVALASSGGTLGTTFRINVDGSSPSPPAAVFARIIGTGMDIVDRLSKLTTHNLGFGYLSQAPMLQLDNKITADDLVQVKRIYRYAGTMDDFNTYGVNFPVVTENIQDVVCMTTSLGELCVRLFPDVAPLTVANFMNYVNRGAYNNSFMHRFVNNFIVQGGGFTISTTTGLPVAIAADAPVVNEYSKPNVRGTIAMAKLGGDTNSATSQWFLNLADNTDTLGTSNNGGYTVFGEVIPSSLGVLSYMSFSVASDLSASYGSTFGETPLVYDSTGTNSNLITITSVFTAQRDINAPTPVAVGPLDKILTLGTYGYLFTGQAARFALRTNNKLYMVVMNQDLSAGDPNLFNIDTTRIVELIENGRIASSLVGDQLTIPTIRFGDNIYTNLVLQLVDKRTLQFRMISFDPF